MDYRLVISLAVSLVVPILVAILISRVVLVRLDRSRSAARGWEPKSTAYHAIRMPMMIVGIVIGLSMTSIFLRDTDIAQLKGTNWGLVDLWLQAIGTVAAFMILYRFMVYGVRITGDRTDTGVAVLLRKLLAAIFLVIAGVTVLNQFGIQVGPVLASLGVAGLAAALALQDTLSNYFAGILIAIDKPIRPGDFIKIEGNEGFVESIGWRTTRIRPYAESIVVVPNSKVANTILTNMAYPTTESRVYVPIVVAYDTDLTEVQALTVDVAREIQESVSGADPSFEPVVVWDRFGDAGIEFRTVLRADHFDHMGAVRGAFMKAIVSAYREKGIVMARRIPQEPGAVLAPRV